MPPTDKTECATPAILIRHDPYTAFEAPEKVLGTPRPHDSVQRLAVQDDLDPDSLSDASKSDEGSIVEGGRKLCARQVEGRAEVTGGAVSKPTSFYIGSDEAPSISPQALSPVLSLIEREQSTPPKTSPTTVLTGRLSNHEFRTPVKQNSSAPILHSRDNDPSATKEPPGSFVRQESFTKDRTSNDSQMNKLPHISSHPTMRDMDPGDLDRGDSGHDTQSFLRETENALAALEAKFQAHSQGQDQRQEGSSGPIEDSLSAESDVDTSSTVSLVSNKNDPNMVPRKHSVISGPQKEKSSSSSSAQDQSWKPSARERLSEKRRTPGSDSGTKAELAKRYQMRRSTGNRGSLDLSDEPNLQYWPDTVSSDHESSSRPTTRKKIIPLQKEDSGKSSTKVYQSLTRSNSLSAPRATRASMLRRARLGDASDNEGAETDRASQLSDVNAPAPKASSDSKKLSRLDILALPRKRTGSFTTPSDTESSAGKTGFSARSSESSSSVRKASAPDPKSGPRRNSATSLKQPLGRTRSSSAKYASSTASSRRRQKGSDYTSTSDEEYDSNRSTPKHKRSHTSAATQTSRTPTVALARSKARSRESEDENDNEGDPFQNWTSHSAEIARYYAYSVVHFKCTRGTSRDDLFYRPVTVSLY